VRVTAGLAESKAAYCRVYDSCHLQADCQEPGQLRNPTLGNHAGLSSPLSSFFASDSASGVNFARFYVMLAYSLSYLFLFVIFVYLNLIHFYL